VWHGLESYSQHSPHLVIIWQFSLAIWSYLYGADVNINVKVGNVLVNVLLALRSCWRAASSGRRHDSDTKHCMSECEHGPPTVSQSLYQHAGGAMESFPWRRMCMANIYRVPTTETFCHKGALSAVSRTLQGIVEIRRVVGVREPYVA